MWRKKSNKNKYKGTPDCCTLLKMDVLEKASKLTGAAGS